MFPTDLKATIRSFLKEQMGLVAEEKEAHGEYTITLPCSLESFGPDLMQSNVRNFFQFLRDEPTLQFEQLIDLCGVDYSTYGTSDWVTHRATAQGFDRARRGEGDFKSAMPCRFGVVCHLLSLSRNHRLRVKLWAELYADGVHRVPSLTGIWTNADWYEREAYDLFGIWFEGHPDLRRILTDYGFIGHPFRKDFPLGGEVEVRYDAEAEQVVYEPNSIEDRVLVARVIREEAGGTHAE